MPFVFSFGSQHTSDYIFVYQYLFDVVFILLVRIEL